MPRVFLGVGSNIDPEANVERSLLLLARKVRIRGLSTVYLTRPEGGRDQPRYYNCVVEVETGLSPARLKAEVLRPIERALGRSRGPDPHASRPCDLDILLYDELTLRTEEVTIPDPHFMERPYLLQAVRELARDILLPGGAPLAQAAQVRLATPLVALPELTTRLRKEIVMAVDTQKIEGLVREVRTTMGSAYFTEQTDSMVIIRDIEMYSLCEHHLLPFFGRCHIGYLAREKVAGCSKLARIVDMFSRRLQIQERLTEQISHAVKDVLDVAGVGVMIEAHHLCMMMRGVQKQNSKFVTSSLLGVFREPEYRAEFYSLVRREGAQ